MNKDIRKEIVLTKKDWHVIESDMEKEGFKTFSVYARRRLLAKEENDLSLLTEQLSELLQVLKLQQESPELLKEMQWMREYLINEVVPNYVRQEDGGYIWRNGQASKFRDTIENLRARYYPTKR